MSDAGVNSKNPAEAAKAEAKANKKERRAVKVAVNQDYVGVDHPVKAGDEIALFPPVTGG